jgi:hypothetical protein
LRRFSNLAAVTAGLLSTLLADSASAETLADYALVKTAGCISKCVRVIKLFPDPPRGVTIGSESPMSPTSAVEIVDFETKTVSALVYERTRENYGWPPFKLTKRTETKFDDADLSLAISIANRIWNPSPPARQAPDAPCTDSFYALTLFDGPAVLERQGLCGPDDSDVREFSAWLNMILGRTQANP